MEEKNGVGLSVASMVLGILSLVFGCCFYYLAFPCSLLGLILAAVSLKGKKGGKGMAIAGLVTSIIGIIPALIGIALGGAIASELF